MGRRTGPSFRLEERYPGLEDWTAEAVRERYLRYCRILKVRQRDVTPRYPDGFGIGQTMNVIIEGIKADDTVCVMIGIDLLEEDRGIPCGKLLKSRMARALRRHARLDDVQQARLRRRFTDMLLRGYLPREYKEYAKLFRKLGLGIHRDAIEKADQSNPFIRRWCYYLLTDHEAPRQQNRLRHW